jgi:hypothetical protein
VFVPLLSGLVHKIPFGHHSREMGAVFITLRGWKMSDRFHVRLVNRRNQMESDNPKYDRETKKKSTRHGAEYRNLNSNEIYIW